MEKVRREEKKRLDGAGSGHPKKKKRKKDLDELRKNVFEARRNLRQKAAPLKTQKATFTKVLNQFAEKRQENKPGRQLGFFANGSKGAEAKRATLPLDRARRARLQGAMNMLLDDGRYESKKTLPGGLDNILRSSSPEKSDVDDPLSIQNGTGTVLNEFGQSPILGRQTRSKRKLAETINEPDKKLKKPDLKIVLLKTIPQNATTTRTQQIQRKEKCKRRLFEDDETDFNPIDQVDVEEIRFSPEVAKSNISSPQRVIGRKEKAKEEVESTNLNLSTIGWSPATRYEELCAMICAENFEDCLQDIPYVDPLKNVTETLRSLFAETCRQHHLRKKMKAAERGKEHSSDSDSCVVLSDNDKKTAHHPYKNVQQLYNPIFPRKERSDFHPSEYSSGSPVPRTLKRSSFMRQKKRVTGSKLRKSSSSDEELSTDSVDSKKSKVRFETDPERSFELRKPKPLNLQSAASSMFDNIEKGREMLMQRYLESVSNAKQPKEKRSMFPREAFVPPSERTGPKRYIGDPLRRHEIGVRVAKNSRHVPAILRRSNNSSTVKTGNSRVSSEYPDLGIFSGHSQLKTGKTKLDGSQSDVASCKKPAASSSFIAIPEILELEERKCELLTPSVSSVTQRQHDQVLRAKANFMNAKYKRDLRSEAREVPADLSHPKVLKFQNNAPLSMREPTVQFPGVYRPVNFDEDAMCSFQDQRASKQNDAEKSHGRPIYIQRRSVPFQQRQQQVLLQNVEPKVIIVPNPGARKEERQGEANGSGMVFVGLPRNAQRMPEMPVYDVARPMQQLPTVQMPEFVYRNPGHQAGNVQRSKMLFEHAAHAIPEREFPKSVYQNGTPESRRVRNPGMVYSMDSSETPKFDQSTVGRNGQARTVLKGQANLQRQNSVPRHVKLTDGQIGIFVPKNEAYQHFANVPGTSQQVLEKYSTVYVKDESDFNFILDPGYPQAGYQRNQVDGISKQDYQRVIQPVYNISDAYHPQVAPNYFAHDF